MFIESLEERRLMSAPISLAHGVLSVRGGDGNDRITLTQKGSGKAPQVTVSVVGSGRKTNRTFAPAQIRQISITGMAGNDDVSMSFAAFNGKTTIRGDAGNDHINVITSGTATLLGGAGDDKLIADFNKKSITIDGGDGNDNIRGGAGADRLTGGPGNDSLAGASGNDNIKGGDDNDLLSGGEGDDLLLGESGIDQIGGDGGNDFLDGGSGSNVLSGGAGDDTFFADNADFDGISGGDGNDQATVDPIDVTNSGPSPSATELESFKNRTKIEAVRIALIQI